MKLAIILVSSILCASQLVTGAEECGPGSLDNLQLVDLLRKSNQGDKCLREARNVFQTKYKDHNYYFQDRYYYSDQGAIYFTGIAFRIRNVKVIHRFLANFGDLIKGSMTISFQSFTVDEGKDIVAQVDKKCHASLETLTIEEIKGNVIDELKHTFNNLTWLQFTTSRSEASAFVHKMDKFFPNLETLHVDQTRASDWTFIVGKFPKLNRFSVTFGDSNIQGHVEETQLISFFKENPHVDEVEIRYPTLKLFKAIDEHMPLLKKLQISHLSEDYANHDSDVHMNHLKELSLYSFTSLENVTFDRLDNLVFFTYYDLSKNSSIWVNFLTNQMNSKLRKLLIGIDNLDSEGFLQVPEIFPQLKDVTFMSRPNVTVSHIVEYLEKSKDLIDFWIDVNMNEDQKNELKGKLPKNWKMVHPSSYIRLERTGKSFFGGNGGANSLIVNHMTQMLAAILIVGFVKLF